MVVGVNSTELVEMPEDDDDDDDEDVVVSNSIKLVVVESAILTVVDDFVVVGGLVISPGGHGRNFVVLVIGERVVVKMDDNDDVSIDVDETSVDISIVDSAVE